MTATTMTYKGSNNAMPTLLFLQEQQQDNIIMLFLRADGMKSTTDKPDNIFGAADAFFEISNDHGELVAQSNIMFNDSTPKWAPIRLNLEALCGNDDHRRVFISFYDYQSNGEHGLIKTIVTTVDGMKRSAADYQEQSRVVQPSCDDRVNVFIYDTIVTTGTATVGTLTKKSKHVDIVDDKLKMTAPPTVATVSDSLSEDDADSTDDRIGRIILISPEDESENFDDDDASLTVEEAFLW